MYKLTIEYFEGPHDSITGEDSLEHLYILLGRYILDAQRTKKRIESIEITEM